MSRVSGLYPGEVTHRRLRPVVHKLRYRIFQMLFDLDELPHLSHSLRLFSYNRFNLFSFHDRDHLAGTGEALRLQVERHLSAAGIDLRGGAIQVLCMPRLLGLAFNPISVYFCHHRDGGLAAMLYEVNNTFGQRHSYLIPATNGDEPIIQECAKRFYVSPFFDLEMTYRFQVTLPDETVSLVIHALSAHPETAGETMITTRFAGTRQEISDASLWRTFLGHPLLMLKVVGGIHWEALRLWRKGLRLQPRPPAPSEPMSIHIAQPADRSSHPVLPSQR